MASNDINMAVVNGRLTRDCESSMTRTGTSVVKFSIANKFYDRSKKTQEVNYIDVTVFGKIASALEVHLKQGRIVSVKGQIRQDRWISEGETKKRFFIVADEIQLINDGKKAQDRGPEDFEDDEFPEF